MTAKIVIEGKSSLSSVEPGQGAIQKTNAPISLSSNSPLGFTLIEVLTCVAVLVIVLGLMVSLARYVRKESAEQLTRDMLRQLDDIAQDFLKGNPTGLDGVTTFVPPGNEEPTEPMLQDNARKNNEAFVRVLRPQILRPQLADEEPATQPASARDAVRNVVAPRIGHFGNVPLSLYDEAGLRDAWGKPIIYMPQMHRLIGMAPLERPYFFFSAGPDGNYLTRDDNLYSYEATPGRAGK